MKYTIPKFVTAKAESRIMIHLVITGKRDKVAYKQKSQIAVILSGLKMKQEKAICKSYQKSAIIKKAIMKITIFPKNSKY